MNVAVGFVVAFQLAKNVFFHNYKSFFPFPIRVQKMRQLIIFDKFDD